MFPSQEAVRFKTSASWVRLLGFLMVLCLSGVGWGVGLLVIGRSLIPASLLILFSGSLAALCWNGIGHLRDQIAVDKTGIWRLPPKGQPVFIAWDDVGVVRADDTTQRLTVSDRSRAHTIRLEYQLENFSALRDFVL